MARWIAVGLGVVVVGLLVAGMPWGTTAADEDRIAALKARVAVLEARLDGNIPIDLTCAEGEIVGRLSDNLGQPGVDPNGVTLHWVPSPGEGFGPLSSYAVGVASFRGCT